MSCDITKREEVNAIFDAIQTEYGSVNILVNNAGCLMSVRKPTISRPKALSILIFSQVHYIRHTMILEDDNDAELQQTIDTNVSGTVHCTKAAYRQLRASGDYGHIININSILGHCVVKMGDRQMMNLYPGTKHMITAMTEVLRQELITLNNLKVRISVSFHNANQID